MAATPAEARPGIDVLDGLEIRRASTAEQVAKALREMIMRGEVQPGTPLKELPLAQSIGVSRNSMREAIRVLAREGLVTHQMHRGAVVTRLTRDDVADLFRVRRALELSAIEVSGDASPSQVASLEESVAGLERACEQGDLEGMIESDHSFHERLVALLGSPRLDRFFETIQAELRLCLAIVDREEGDPRDLIAEHRELCELIASGQRARCAELMRGHLADAEERVGKIVRGWDGQREQASRDERTRSLASGSSSKGGVSKW